MLSIILRVYLRTRSPFTLCIDAKILNEIISAVLKDIDLKIWNVWVKLLVHEKSLQRGIRRPPDTPGPKI